jgi:hypothetical protein
MEETRNEKRTQSPEIKAGRKEIQTKAKKLKQDQK